jgi:hypothetical protein
MGTMKKGFRFGLALLALKVLGGCATLGQVIQPPQFSVAPDRPAELQLLGPSLQNPVGGVTVRIWTRVQNPNPVGVTLSSLAGNLVLEGAQAAQVEFPLGLPLTASGDAVIPLEFQVSFANVPRLADVVSRAVTQGTVAYSLNGRVAVDAGLLGQPTFGPMNFVQGSIQTRR